MDKTFLVPHEPVGKGRPRVTIFGGKPRLYTPAKTRAFESFVAKKASTFLDKTDGPIRVDILAIASRPKRLMRKKDPDGLIYRTVKPDADNVRKAVLDGLSAFFDDKQVVCGDTIGLYSEKGFKGRVLVRVTTELCSPEKLIESLFPMDDR